MTVDTYHCPMYDGIDRASQIQFAANIMVDTVCGAHGCGYKPILTVPYPADWTIERGLDTQPILDAINTWLVDVFGYKFDARLFMSQDGKYLSIECSDQVETADVRDVAILDFEFTMEGIQNGYVDPFKA